MKVVSISNFFKFSKRSMTVLKDDIKRHKFLITGCGGQIGTALVPKMVERYGEDNVVISDITRLKSPSSTAFFERLDVTDLAHYKYLIEKHQITYIIHLSGILSASGERNPYLALKVNTEGVINALDMAKFYNAKIFIPSTIAVFGPDTVKQNVPNNVPLSPTTMYGVTKVFLENIGNYYSYRHDVDFRSVRYPGVISPYEYESNGSTDYASEIFFAAKKNIEYSICLSPDTNLPMTDLDDIIEGTIKLLEADRHLLTQRVYNIHGLNFAPEEIAREIQKHFPNFKYKYEPDFRDQIARNWPESLDDQLARRDWGWNPKCKDVPTLVEENFRMIGKDKI